MGFDYELAEDAYWVDPLGAEKELRAFEAFQKEEKMAAPARRGRPTGRPAKAAPTRRQAPAVPAKPSRDVTQYADKEPTPYHKAFATWILKEVGFSLEGKSAKAAFLAGVSIATAARAAFQESDFLEEWREKTGEVKRGPKPAAEKAAPARRRKPEPEPEPEDEDEEWEEDESDADDDEFDSEDDAEEDDEEADDDGDDWEDEEDEPAPAPKTRRAAPAKSAPRKSAPTAGKAPMKRTSASASKAVSTAGATRGKQKPPADADDYIF